MRDPEKAALLQRLLICHRHKLTGVERLALRRYYGMFGKHPKTLREIAEELSFPFSRSAVGAARDRAEAKLLNAS